LRFRSVFTGAVMHGLNSVCTRVEALHLLPSMQFSCRCNGLEQPQIISEMVLGLSFVLHIERI
jgi:hypothetical protein